MAIVLLRIIDIIGTILVIVIFADIILSYFMSPYHPVRETLDRIVQPMLNPIRRFVRPIGGLDLSPLILLIGIQLLEALLQRLVIALFV